MSHALIVLGAAVWPGGVPSPTLQRRLNRALQIWKAEHFEYVIPCGGLGAHAPSEAEVMRGFLRANGVPETQILLEDRSGTTLQNAENAIALMLDHGIAHAVVVTDGYHCSRAWLSFWALGMRVRVVSAARATPRPRFGVALKAVLRETVALPVYAMRLMLRRR